jgi:CubicO group peptidase (beta-lactamase class C family)
VGHLVDQEPLPGRWHNCTPALASAGLWTTPADLARFIVALSDATHGKPNAILSEPLASAMLTRQVDDSGLGLILTGKDRGLTLMHYGANPGYTCRLIACPATGQGAVIMTNSDSGERLINELVENLKTEYGWP